MRILSLCALLLAVPVAAQRAERDTSATPTAVRLSPIAITATRSPLAVFLTPKPVLVLDRAMLRERQANTLADLFVDQPGLDVTGVGVNQVRPVIRGQRGQRILLLENGLRLNNTRRQQDFGELPALVDLESIERIEVVRGPASVLYGSDAIGGVVNVITRMPSTPGVQGGVRTLYGTAGEQQRVQGQLSGRTGAWSFAASGMWRDAGSYVAPAGTFGAITLADTTRVEATGTTDASLNARLAYDVGTDQQVWAAYGRYQADTSGFGFVDPAAYDPGAPAIHIRYPEQVFQRMSAGLRGAAGLPVADRVDVSVYRQTNDRTLLFDVFVPFGPPGAGVLVDQRNVTNIETVGGRLELAALLGGAVRLTYGVDVFRDAALSADTSIQTVTGFGPSSVDSVTTPSVPEATFRSAGVFAQADIRAVDRLAIVVAGRYQDVRAATSALTAVDRTVVGSLGLTYLLGDRVSLIGTVGRAFRSPNLVERFLDGPLAEGGAYQSPNANLVAEKSLNLDLGMRYRDRRIAAEAFVFRSEITDGIRAAATGNMISGLPEFANVNVDRLRTMGFEGSVEAAFGRGFGAGVTYTQLASRDIGDPDNPVGDSYGSKVTGRMRAQPIPALFVEYAGRVQGRRRDILAPDANPLGTDLPGFVTHGVRAGWTFLEVGRTRHRVLVGVTNLANTLYTESANATFFRPEAGRALTVSYDLSF